MQKISYRQYTDDMNDRIGKEQIVDGNYLELRLPLDEDGRQIAAALPVSLRRIGGEGGEMLSTVLVDQDFRPVDILPSRITSGDWWIAVPPLKSCLYNSIFRFAVRGYLTEIKAPGNAEPLVQETIIGDFKPVETKLS